MVQAGQPVPMDRQDQLIMHTMKLLVELGHQSHVPDTTESQVELMKTIRKTWEKKKTELKNAVMVENNLKRVNRLEN